MAHPRPYLSHAQRGPTQPADNARICRLAVIGDLHGNLPALHKVMHEIYKATDGGHNLYALLLTGDFTALDTRRGQHSHAASEEVFDALQCVRMKFTATCVGGVPGNHDVASVADTDILDGRWTQCHQDGLIISGIGGGGPECFGWPYEWSEEDLRDYLTDRFPDGIPEGVILSHCPPKGLRDANIRGHECGSVVLREVAAEHRGLFICGHIHEARGVAQIGDCTVVNAGSLGRPYPWIGYTLIEGSLDAGWKVDFVEVKES